MMQSTQPAFQLLAVQAGLFGVANAAASSAAAQGHQENASFSSTQVLSTGTVILGGFLAAIGEVNFHTFGFLLVCSAMASRMAKLSITQGVLQRYRNHRDVQVKEIENRMVAVAAGDEAWQGGAAGDAGESGSSTPRRIREVRERIEQEKNSFMFTAAPGFSLAYSSSPVIIAGLLVSSLLIEGATPWVKIAGWILHPSVVVEGAKASGYPLLSKTGWNPHKYRFHAVQKLHLLVRLCIRRGLPDCRPSGLQVKTS